MLRVKSARHRYLPVINRSPDIIEGIWDRETGKIEDALFVPESVTLDDLLVTLKRSGKPLAVVLDEYGGTAGIIALADILELIFGPGVYGNPDEEPAIVERGENLWEVDARANLDEVGRVLGVELEAGDADRISGWVAYHAERLPHVGQEIEADGCRATILKRRRRRVVSVLMKVETQPRATDEEILAETDEEVEKAVED
jgi:CBS domain containing-hemolysin-like protein